MLPSVTKIDNLTESEIEELKNYKHIDLVFITDITSRLLKSGKIKIN